MNKKLIAVAVAGACVAPAAMAQTANPVTLYGRVHATFESVEASAGTFPTLSPALVRRNRVSDQASLLGVRGTEDLGGGLKAFFQLETAFKPDQNDTTFAARNSGVGLQGGWGSLLLGRWDTPFKVVTTAIDPYGDVTIGGWTSAMNGSGVNGAQATFDRRDQNVVQYWSPSWAGIAVRLSYSANEGRTATTNPRSNGASVSYTGGPLYLAYGYHELKDTAAAGLTLTLNASGAVTAVAFPATSALGTDQKAHAIVGSFTFGPVKIGAAYEKIKRDIVVPASPAVGSLTGFSDQKAFAANVVWTMGRHQLIYQFQKAKDGGIRVQGTANTAILVTQPECKVNTPGYQYNFSRRTFFLAQYTKVDNNATGTCNFGSNTLTPAGIGVDLKGFSLGLRHVF
jgi:predicted porin